MNKFITCCLSLMIAMTVMADEWTLVTDASTLKAGDQIVFGYASDGYTAGLTISSGTTKALLAVQSTFSGEKITSLNADAAILTLSGSASGWTFTNQDGKALGASALKKLAWGEGTTTWTISISNGTAAVASTNSSYGKLQYNYNQGNPRWANYNSTQKDGQIYRRASTTPPAETYSLSYQGFPYRKTLCEEPTYEAGTVLTLSNATPTQGGKTLTGWRYDGVVYEPGASFTMPAADVVLAPIWDHGTDIDQTNIRTQAVKILRNGQLVIIRDGVEYNAQGTRIN